ncbi:MAG: hypothetical protein H7Z41_06695 [Cytophagales bacterium]|nr:hypothetical protein [Armatimonadota bacterium]
MSALLLLPSLLLLGLVSVLLAFAPTISRALCRSGGLVRPNFRGNLIPASTGLTFLLILMPVYAALLFWPLFRRDAALYLLVVTSFGLLGLADDRWGSRTVGGFRGHLRSLLTPHPTTGALKLVGGGGVALIASAVVHAPVSRSLVVLLLFFADALLIALCANALNLLDLRPGRAQFGFALLLLPSLLTAFLHQEPQGILPFGAGIAALREWRADSRADTMMGDTGSNLLGAAAGLSAVLFLPLGGRLLLLVLVIALNTASERFSLTRLIAESPVLNSLDRLLGAR